MTDQDLSLETRDGLPEPLRVLLRDYPREAWEAHPRFGGLVQFWLERHMMFRKLMAMLEDDSRQVLDRRLDPRIYAARLSRFGGTLINQLHGHHRIEDAHYFPTLSVLDQRISSGFAILDKDHHALDGWLQSFTVSANGVLQTVSDDARVREAAAPLRQKLLGFERMLDRHLEDEEELVVPVVLANPDSGLG